MIHVIFAAVSALAGATGTYVFMDARHAREISDIRSDAANALADANARALAETQRLQAAKDAALKAAATRQSALARDLAANRDALSRLSDAADSAIRTASDSHGSCQRVVATYADIQQQCASRLVEVGTAADRAISEAVTLREAWPK